MTEPTPSPIVRVLNQDVGRYHRWCTPSILEDQERVIDFYASDVSISAGFFGTLVDHTGVFEEAERFAAAGPGRRPHDVLGARHERLQLDRAADARARALRRARPRRAQHPPLDHQRAEGVRHRLPLPADAVRAAVRGAAAAERRGDQRGPAPLPRGARGDLHEPDLRGARREHARDRRGRARHLAARDGDRRRGLGRAPALPRRPAVERDGVRRRRRGAVDAQARRRAAADRADPLARAARGLRADGGGVPRVRHDLAELPPARERGRRRAHARRQGRGGARDRDRPHPRAEGGAARAPARSRDARRPGVADADDRPRRGHRPREDDGRARALRAVRATTSRRS